MMRWGDRDEEFVRPVRGLVMLHGERGRAGHRAAANRAAAKRAATASSARATIEIARADDYEALPRAARARWSRTSSCARARSASSSTAAAGGAIDRRRRRALRRGDRAGRVPGGLRGALREGVPRSAAGMPDADDEAEPEVLPARRRTREAPQPVPHRVEHGDPAPAPHRARQRARAAGAARRREVLLRPGPARDARVARAGPGERRLSTTSSARSSSASSASSGWPAIARRRCGADEARRGAPRGSARPTSLTGMVGEFPELQGIMGTYYARHDGEPEAVAARDRGALPPALRRRRAARRRASAPASRSRTSSTRSPASVRRRPAADRRQGPVRAAPRRRSA